MIYQKTVYRKLGDLYILVEFGDEPRLQLNFRVIALDLAIKKMRVPGVIETIPIIRSLAILYDPRKITPDELITRLKQVEEELGELAELPSRFLKMPVWYNDPWSIECAQAHRDSWDHQYGGGCSSNLDYVAKYNNLTVEEVVDVHSKTDWWVMAVGFTPGVWLGAPLNPKYNIIAPKYNVPRTWTPDRAIGVGTAGIMTAMYSVRSPGGIQLIGRSPWNIYEPTPMNRIFKKDPVLVRVGDRVRFMKIGEEEYWKIRKAVEAGSYDYEASIEEGVFKVKDYLSG